MSDSQPPIRLRTLHPTANTNQIREFLFKILVLGDYGVGKTAIVRRYSEGRFTPNYKITIGADFSIKSFMYDDYTKVTIQLWDIAGHERFGHTTRIYYKYAVAAAIVFDVTRFDTLDSIKKWLLDLRSKVSLIDGSSIPVVLFANKWDVKGTLEINEDKIGEICEQLKIVDWFPTSAKENFNIENAFGKLVEQAIYNKSREEDLIIQENEGFNLNNPQTTNTADYNRSKCCY